MIEKHVTNFEISRRLSELGVKKESIFYWRDNDGYEEGSDFLLVSHINKSITIWYASAYTASELLEMLPTEVMLNPYSDKEHYEVFYIDFGKINQSCGGYYCSCREKSGVILEGMDYMEEYLQNALAKMLIYLIENGIVEVGK